MKKNIFTFLIIAVCCVSTIFAQIPVKTLVQISRAEDELRFDKTLEDLIKNPNSQIRMRQFLPPEESVMSALFRYWQKSSLIQPIPKLMQWRLLRLARSNQSKARKLF